MSKVLGKRLAPNSFWVHSSGWAVVSVGGKTLADHVRGNSALTLGLTSKVLAVPAPSSGAFVLGPAGTKWETDGKQWLVVSRSHRNALAVFCIRAAF